MPHGVDSHKGAERARKVYALLQDCSSYLETRRGPDDVLVGALRISQRQFQARWETLSPAEKERLFRLADLGAAAFFSQLEGSPEVQRMEEAAQSKDPPARDTGLAEAYRTLVRKLDPQLAALGDM